MIIQEISTHKAVKTKLGINITLKGFCFDGYSCKDEILYTIPLNEIDDVDYILERYREGNRINMNEFINSINK